MLDHLEKKYEKLQDENLNLMVSHLNKPKGTPYCHKLLVNNVLMTKIKQMIKQAK